MMTFAHQVHHVAGTERYIISRVGAALGRGEPLAELPPNDSLPDGLALLKATWGDTASLVARLDDDDLDRTITFPGESWSAQVRRFLQVVVEHQIHHRGQLIVYYRCLGLEPPKRWNG
jgi:uncharacterized damage-inducible protein DinB